MDPTALLIGQDRRQRSQSPGSLLGEGDYDGNEENTSELADVGGEYDFSAEKLPKSGELETSEASSGPEEPDTISFRGEPDRQRGVPSTGSGRKSPKTAEEDVKKPENAHKTAENAPEMPDEAISPGMRPMSVEMVPEDPVEVNEQARMPVGRLAGAGETTRLGEPESLAAPDVVGEPFGLVEEDLLEPAKPVDWPSVLGDTVAPTGVSDQGQAEQPDGEPTRDVASSASRNEGGAANIIKMSEPPEGAGTPDIVAPPSIDAGDRELGKVERRLSKLENFLRWREESEGMA